MVINVCTTPGIGYAGGAIGKTDRKDGHLPCTLPPSGTANDRPVGKGNFTGTVADHPSGQESQMLLTVTHLIHAC